MNPNLDLLGEVEQISFPSKGLSNIPARVDTGARTSALWASGISLGDDQKLRFKMFGKSSPFYTGKEITVKDHQTINVLSSNGISERRYKIKLLVEVRGRRMKASFTLTDRSKQTYPVLIGRNVLRGKFIVNVTLRRAEQQNAKENANQ